MTEDESNFQGNINRYVKNGLEKLVFKCPYDEQCKFQGPYYKALEHLNDC